jgi:hypothetical protein
VLCPYGIPSESRVACTTILVHCSGDMSRMIDAPAGEQVFLRHLKRVASMVDTVRPPIVLLTSVMPLMTRVVLVRERYEAEIPSLRRADWLLFLERDTTVFVGEALRRGRLDRAGSAAIWHGPARMKFLVVSPESGRADLERGMDTLGRLQDPGSDPSPSGPKLPITRKIPIPESFRKH